MELFVAFSTDDGDALKTDDHAGMAVYFDVYRFADGTAEFVERRTNPKMADDETAKHGDVAKAKNSLSALKNVHVWASARFGPNLPRLLKKLLCVVVRVKTVADGVALIQDNLEAVSAQVAEGEERKHLVLTP